MCVYCNIVCFIVLPFNAKIKTTHNDRCALMSPVTTVVSVSRMLSGGRGAASMPPLLLLLLVWMISVHNVTSEQCFRCGHEPGWPCPADGEPIASSFTAVSDQSLCVQRGSCLKFTGKAILLPGRSITLTCRRLAAWRSG